MISYACFAQEQQPQSPPAEHVSEANNPLADLNGLDFRNHHMPSLYGVSDGAANTIIRGTLPLATVPMGQGEYRSGSGDFSICDAIQLTPSGAATDFAVGPLLVAPTETNSALGQGKWQARRQPDRLPGYGAAFVRGQQRLALDQVQDRPDDRNVFDRRLELREIDFDDSVRFRGQLPAPS
jgi:hypothetical protein